MKHSVEWWGKGRGVSRIMRKTGQRTGAQILTLAVVEELMALKAKDWSQKLNSKQKTIARNSAIAASADSEMVSSRGHQFDENVRFPIIIDSYTESREGSIEKFEIESLPLQNSTRKFVAMMEGLGLGADLVEPSRSNNTCRERYYERKKI